MLFTDPPEMKNNLKILSASAIRWSGLLPMLGRFGPNLAILTFHRIVTEEQKRQSLNKPMMVTEDQFDSLLKTIKHYGHVISLAEAIQRIRHGDSFRPGTVAITFDDGYYDFYLRAWPLLKAYEMPATLFLTTSVIGNHDQYFWWDEFDCYARICRDSPCRPDGDITDELKYALQLIERLQANRTESFEAEIREALNRVPVVDRNRFIEKFRAMLPHNSPRDQLMLTWDNVREISDIVDIENHTVSHHLLDQLDALSIRDEIMGASKKIEKETGRRCRGLAYPAGVFTPQASAIARDCGMEYAVTTRFSNNSAATNLMSLDRKDAGYLFVGERIEASYYKVAVSGLLDRYRKEYTDSPGVLSSQTVKDETHDVPGTAPLIVHVIYHLAVGGLENGLVNLINQLPVDRYRHAIICLTGYTDFRNRIRNSDVRVYVLHKRPGKDLRIYPELWRLFRQLRPDIVHTRNLSTLEAQFPAMLARVPHRIHGEHGRDVSDLDGTSRKYQLLRKLFSPIVQHYIVLSLDLEHYLRSRVGIPSVKINHICNGVDTRKFRPANRKAADLLPVNFSGDDKVVIGTVGRMEAVKDQTTLVNAFIRLVQDHPQGVERLRLVMIGDGALREAALSLLEAACLCDIAWLPGERDNIPDLLAAMDVFVLPSLAEGISNTILEAMACGLPVVATDVGGNSELVIEGSTGFLVPRSDPDALAGAIRRYVDDPELRAAHGQTAHLRCEAEFSINTMVKNYQNLYDDLLSGNRKSTVVSASGC